MQEALLPGYRGHQPSRLNTPYLEGLTGDLGNRLIRGRFGITIWVIGVINLLTKFP